MNIPEARTATELIARGVILDDDRILLARQRGKSWFFLPGGHVDTGERIESALTRELIEELGTAAEVTGFAGAVEHAYEEDEVWHHELNLVFTVHLADATPISHEDHLEFLFLKLADLQESDVRPRTLKDALTTWLSERRPFWRAASG